MPKKIITQSIAKGLEKAYYQNIIFKNPQEELSVNLTEYLITVNIAQELFDSELRKIPNLSFHLEYDADDFKSNAFDLLKWDTISENPLKTQMLKRNDHKSSRKGRIDLAILKKSPKISIFHRSWIGIELKSISRSFDLVLVDFLRLQDAMTSEDPISENSIENCFIGFIFRLDTPKQLMEEKIYEAEKQKCIANLEKLLNDVLDKNNLSYEICSFDIYKMEASKYAESIPEDWWDENDIIANSGAVIGIIITLSRV